jgi:hypothetical protein
MRLRLIVTFTGHYPQMKRGHVHPQADYSFIDEALTL